MIRAWHDMYIMPTTESGSQSKLIKWQGKQNTINNGRRLLKKNILNYDMYRVLFNSKKEIEW